MLQKKESQKKKIMTDINIFIENEYEDFSQNIDTAKLTKDAVAMTEYFLKNKEWVNESCLKDYDFSLLYFDVVLCNDERIHEINHEYREKDCPTDVITFALFSDSPKEERFIFDNEINLGEIIISLDKALSQSKDKSHEQESFEDELYFLLAHGILHLLGYDHLTEEMLQNMWHIQQEMIKGSNLNV